MRIRPLPLLLPLMLATIGFGENIVFEATGTVTVAQFSTGPFAQAQPGDTVTVFCELITPGSHYSSTYGTGTDYVIDRPTFLLDIGGATVGLADPSGAHVMVENDSTYGDHLTTTISNLDADSMVFMLGVADSTAAVFDSDDLLDLLGTWPATLFDYTDIEVLNGTGALLASVDSITLREESEGTVYCAGDGSAWPCPCGNTGGPGEGCANSTGAGATLRAFGSPSVSADDLGFAATGLLAGQPALLFVGNNALNGGMGTPFGDGLRCVGGAVRRLVLRIPDATGAARWEAGLPSLVGGWAAGDVKRFQVWYADPVGGPCSSQVNLSSALEVAFLP